MNKIFLMAMMIILLNSLILSGCDKTTPSSEEEVHVTVDEVVANSVDSLEKLNTWCLKQNIYLDIEISGLEKGHVTTSMSQKGCVDRPDKEMEFDMTTSTVVRGESTETRQILYLIEDTSYMRMDTPDMEQQWTKQKLSSSEVDLIWETMTRGLSVSADMLEACHFIKLRMVESDGVSCYLLDGSLDTKKFSKLIQQFMGGSQALPFDVSKMFHDFEIRFWFARDTYNLIKQEMTCTITMEMEGKKIEGEFGGTSRYYDHGKDITIELPPEAEEAMGAN